MSAAVDGTPVNVDQTQCAPAAAPDLPTPADLAGPPDLPPPPDVPQLPQLPAPPSLPVPQVPVPPVQVPPTPTPPVPVPGVAGAALSSGCAFQSAQGTSPTEQSVTLPDGTVIYNSGNPTSLSGYMGGTNSLGKLEGSGSVSTSGVNGQIGGHNNQTGADGYIGSSGACMNGNSVP